MGFFILLTVCCLLTSDGLSQSLSAQLHQADQDAAAAPGISLRVMSQPAQFLELVIQGYRRIDCLIIEDTADAAHIFEQLEQRSILLPMVLIQPTAMAPSRRESDALEMPTVAAPPIYHSAVLTLSCDRISQIHAQIERAIANFIKLDPSPRATAPDSSILDHLTIHSSLMQQQQRLADKLKERLNYLGVYYKRNPANFLRHMSQAEREEVLQSLRDEYRKIILQYFSTKANLLNQRIDTFVNLTFFADISVAQIVEMHIELMDEFSKQLKLEGRSNDILQDYRLALIDVIAHLCEMYRRSIPREP
ncbi:MAG: circadian clock protein KaiA [Kaiparowitsia implicata GSE-PSE-MK54-09C]|nr:circadian clock protein KaiA [Kaiparowitsia implicata GSE-PSE-MK54-09C]